MSSDVLAANSASRTGRRGRTAEVRSSRGRTMPSEDDTTNAQHVKTPPTKGRLKKSSAAVAIAEVDVSNEDNASPALKQPAADVTDALVTSLPAKGRGRKRPVEKEHEDTVGNAIDVSKENNTSIELKEPAADEKDAAVTTFPVRGRGRRRVLEPEQEDLAVAKDVPKENYTSVDLKDPAADEKDLAVTTSSLRGRGRRRVVEPEQENMAVGKDVPKENNTSVDLKEPAADEKDSALTTSSVRGRGRRRVLEPQHEDPVIIQPETKRGKEKTNAPKEVVEKHTEEKTAGEDKKRRGRPRKHSEEKSSAERSASGRSVHSLSTPSVVSDEECAAANGASNGDTARDKRRRIARNHTPDKPATEQEQTSTGGVKRKRGKEGSGETAPSKKKSALKATSSEKEAPDNRSR
jgi:hypothetical protein